MTTRLSDRQAEVDRRYIQMEHHRATLTAAQDAAETQYNTLAYQCEQEIRVRQQVMAVLKLERRFIISLTVFAGAIGALAAGLTVKPPGGCGLRSSPSSVAAGLRWPRGGTRERRRVFYEHRVLWKDPARGAERPHEPRIAGTGGSVQTHARSRRGRLP